jgi:hypothetical protein
MTISESTRWFGGTHDASREAVCSKMIPHNLEIRRYGRYLAAWMTVLLAVCFAPCLAEAQTAPTLCPINYSCSYQSSSTQALIGGPTDGQPQSRVGFLNFDGSGNFTGVLSGSLNGTVVTNRAVSGTCVSGNSTTLATLNFNAGLSGNPASSAFVTSSNGTRTDLLLAGSVLASDTRVIVAVCHGN